MADVGDPFIYQQERPMVLPLERDRVVFLDCSASDPTTWPPQPGKEPTLTMIQFVREWASNRTQEIGGQTVGGDMLAGVILAHVFPTWWAEGAEL